MSLVWQVAEPVPTDVAAQFPAYPPALLQLLWNRGLKTQAEMDAYLTPDWDRDTFSPSLFRHMDQAVARVFASLEKGEVIAVHGDYDADGVSGSAVLLTAMRDICRSLFSPGGPYNEKNLTFYLPHREKEGYGVAVATVESLATERNAKLMITVDCGISNKPAIDRAKELGMDTIVCDHHTMPAELPDAILIHPLVPGETYPNKHLCGTGVAFKLASALIGEARKRGAHLPDGYEKWLLDLVAIATVTDVMPLTGENRALETFGLKVLNKTRRLGLKKLLEIAGTPLGAVDTTTIGFQIGPRLNAAGRMQHASGALELLLAEDDMAATHFGNHLQEVNAARQEASERMYQAAKASVGEIGDQKLIIAAGEGWSPGLVGLVASKLVNDYRRPVLVVGHENGHHVGSGRSVPGYDITATVRAAAEHMDKFGGHPQACGFSVTGAEKFALASEAMHAYAELNLQPEQMVPTLRVDAEIALEDADWALLENLEKLQPFGEGNRSPVFCARGLLVSGVDPVGADGKHLRLAVRSPRGKIVRMIGFRFGHLLGTLRLGQTVDVAFELGVNEWNGRRDIQFKITDLKL